LQSWYQQTLILSIPAVSAHIAVAQTWNRTVCYACEAYVRRTAGFSEPEQLAQRKAMRLIEGFVCNPWFDRLIEFHFFDEFNFILWDATVYNCVIDDNPAPCQRLARKLPVNIVSTV
jgi:hypothetical protein